LGDGEMGRLGDWEIDLVGGRIFYATDARIERIRILRWISGMIFMPRMRGLKK
jgi:hypothetical protein